MKPKLEINKNVHIRMKKKPAKYYKVKHNIKTKKKKTAKYY